MTKKIFIVEDEKELVDILESIFNAEGFEVHKFHSGNDMLKKLNSITPDVILMDLMLPDLSGLQLCKEIREKEKFSDIPIVILTARSDEYDILNAFNFGCADYITKPFNEKILVARIKACLSYKTSNKNQKTQEDSSENIIKFEELEIDPERYEVYANKKFIDLTPLEFKLFYFLAKNQGKVFKRSQIFEEIYENYYNRGDRSIDILVNRLRKKLGKYGSLIETIYGVGYSFKFEGTNF